jgi:L-lysine 2,3-aminomutase
MPEINISSLKLAMEINQVIAHLNDHPEINEIVLRDDPLRYSNEWLRPELERILALPSIRRIGLETSALTTSPQRLDDVLLTFVKQHANQLLFLLRINNARELTPPEVREAALRLGRTGCRRMMQGVIGTINNGSEELRTLVETCTAVGIEPYALYLPAIEIGEELEERLMPLASVSGINLPRIVWADPYGSSENRFLPTAKTIRDELAKRAALITQFLAEKEGGK